MAARAYQAVCGSKLMQDVVSFHSNIELTLIHVDRGENGRRQNETLIGSGPDLRDETSTRTFFRAFGAIWLEIFHVLCSLLLLDFIPSKLTSPCVLHP